MSRTLLELERVILGYRTPLLGPISLRVEQGDFWGIAGPNGAGKTTLVKTLLGVLPPHRGERRVAEPRPRFAYVPQRHHVQPDFPLRVLDVVLLGRTDRLGLGRGPGPADRRVAAEQLERLGMQASIGRPFATLSSGQQQRVLLARALTAEPDVLVLDEPTEGLDLQGEADILAFLRSLHREGRLTTLMVGHRLGEVVNVADHLCLVNHLTGLFECGPLAEMLTEERLSAVYGQPVEIDRCAERVNVHLREPGP
ncbi:MAG TPA: metal ABC transporter ATP-binding protein [Myxococcota bacterium]|nr:metal ABC transporter ATP-binding protein [Myxococcota bacterium]HRY97402.1 metal ABC transporter ATP-binding protein [Myxococcota bacterium]HSA23288.1 metal ABC transporter ATP-binding protein [Myxococcota bacterium]